MDRCVLIVHRPDPPGWARIRAKWAVVKVPGGYGLAFEGKRFAADERPFKRRMDAEAQARANARGEMIQVLAGMPEYTQADFGIK